MFAVVTFFFGLFGLGILQKDSIKCWFHRCASLPSNELNFKNKNKNTSKNANAANEMSLLLLGYGISPKYFNNYDMKGNYTGTLFHKQLFCDEKRKESLATPIINKIGHVEVMESIETTFDLLSSDAFDNFQIRKTIFKDRQFTHFLPLYINKKHGKLCLKSIESYTMKLFKEVTFCLLFLFLWWIVIFD